MTVPVVFRRSLICVYAAKFPVNVTATAMIGRRSFFLIEAQTHTRRSAIHSFLRPLWRRSGHAFSMNATRLVLSSTRAQGVRSLSRRAVRNPETEESMTSGQRNFLLLLTLASAAVAPVFAQTKDHASIPDLSGIWTHSISRVRAAGIWSNRAHQYAAPRERHWQYPEACR